jgi:hypothetical protein
MVVSLCIYIKKKEDIDLHINITCGEELYCVAREQKNKKKKAIFM